MKIERMKMEMKMKKKKEKRKMKKRFGVEESLSSKKRTTIMDLPDEILSEEILRRIPYPVDLWLMTRVSKFWNLLFKSMIKLFSGLNLVIVLKSVVEALTRKKKGVLCKVRTLW